MRAHDPMEHDDIVTYCDIYTCDECPRYGDDCDGREDEDERD